MAETERLVEYLDPAQAAALLGEQAAGLGVTEFARVRNLEFVFPPFELYPLAPRTSPPLDRIAAFAVDMDGTSTTTEPLALHSLEYMVRRITGRMDRAQWPGLDPVLDYPHVIGNSNFRHTEFLLQRYGDWLNPASLRDAFFEALLWTLANLEDSQRRHDVMLNARNCGVAEVLKDPDFKALAAGGAVDDASVAIAIRPFVQRYGGAFRADESSTRVSASLDVYYLRYHSLLRNMAHGNMPRLDGVLAHTTGSHPVAPMPGYGVFLSLIKGWLGADAEGLYELLRVELLRDNHARHGAAELDRYRGRLARLALRFRQHPAKLALVTASIAFEAHAVMKQVISVVSEEVSGWPLPRDSRERLLQRLSDYRAVFDGFVCASDAHEARLKPHRDLYSIALYQMSIPQGDYTRCVGLEDTEPGIVALRAAGVGCAIALPNRDTTRQDYRAAAQEVNGGLPELILVHNLLLKDLG